jgi:hypothetical protein
MLGLGMVTSTLAGCSKPDQVGTTFPVSGTVTFEGRPLTAGMVSFWADGARGNRLELQPISTIDAEGHYSLSTLGKKGAPPGWYKVVVVASLVVPGPQGMETRVGQPLIPRRYGNRNATELIVEVVETPALGAYDLKLQK